MENIQEDPSLCDDCNRPLVEDNYYWCDGCNRLYCDCRYVGCQQPGCDFSSCSYCMNGHRLEHDPDGTLASEPSNDGMSLLNEIFESMLRQLRGLHETTGRLTEHTGRRMDEIVADLKRLHNLDAITTARDHAAVIAEMAGLEYQRQVPRNHIIALSTNRGLADIERRDLTSFQRAHLIIEAFGNDMALHYIAVEASFTAGVEEVRRATRNADYLTRCTGRPAQAVIAAAQISQEIQSTVDTGQVAWYRLDDRDDD